MKTFLLPDVLVFVFSHNSLAQGQDIGDKEFKSGLAQFIADKR